MSKYFAKYLPATDGNFWYVGAVIRQKKTGRLATVKRIGEGLDEREWEHMKLFLCTHDVEIGDKVKWQGKDNKYFDKEVNDFRELIPDDPEVLLSSTFDMWVRQDKAIKVIGPISSGATWVKEGDSWDEDEIKMRVIGNYQIWDFDSTWDFIKYPAIIIVKGPCGHFH